WGRNPTCWILRIGPAGALTVAIVRPPPDGKVGWDAADALAEGWDQARVAGLVSDATSAAPVVLTNGTPNTRRNNSGVRGGRGRRPRIPQRDKLIGLTEPCEFWHDGNRAAYVTFPVHDHKEHWPVRSRDFRMWLSGRFYEETGCAIGTQA